MVGRRDLVGGSVLAGLAGLARPDSIAAEQNDRAVEEIARAIDKLRETLERQAESCVLGPCGTIAQIRIQQKTFLKANHKFPDFIDAGVDSWFDLYDWHIKNSQPLTPTRMADGRYALGFMFTQIVLRPEQSANYISFGYDAR